MKIGIPREIKTREARVSITPAGVAVLVGHGHDVTIEKDAGRASGFSDEAYKKAGAVINPDPDEVWAWSDMVVKVKEPIAAEYHRLKEGQVLFTFLHLAATKELTRELAERKIVAIAYETIQLEDGSLPLPAPMSAVAGRLSIQMGCGFMEYDAA